MKGNKMYIFQNCVRWRRIWLLVYSVVNLQLVVGASLAAETDGTGSIADKLSSLKVDVDAEMWQVRTDNGKQGPLTRREVEKKIAQGDVLDSMMVAKWGTENWIPASSVFEFPEAETSENAESDAEIEAVAPVEAPKEDIVDATEADQFYVFVNNAVQGPYSKEEMVGKIKSGAISADTLVAPVGSAQRVKAETLFSFETGGDPAPPPVPIVPVEKWYVRVDGKNYGPYPQQKLVEMYQNGQVLPATLVNRVGAKNWITVQQALSPQAVNPVAPGATSAPSLKTKAPNTSAGTSQMLDSGIDANYSETRLTNGKILSGLGAATWTSGFILSFVAASKFVGAFQDSLDESEDEDTTAALEAGLDASIGLFVASGLMVHAGPIMSAVGEKVAKRGIGQNNKKGFRSKGMSAARLYGISWIFTLLQVATTFVPVAGMFMSIAFSVTASIYRGYAAWAPIVRLIRRGGGSRGVTSSGISPVVTTNGGGLVFAMSF